MASKTILTHLNLEGNEIQNVSLQKLAVDPTGENLKNGMLWTNTSSNALLKYYDNGAIRTLLWSSGLGDGQTLSGGTTADADLTLQSTTHATKGSIIIPEFSVAGFIKNDASGVITGGNTLEASDIPAHASLTSLYGDADATHFGHVKIGDGIAVASGVISVDVGTGLTLSGTSPNKKVSIDSTVATLTGTQTLSNKTLSAPKFINAGYIADANGNEELIFLTTTNAINELTIANGIAGSAPSLSASGGDTDIDLILSAKGTGKVKIGSSASGNEIVTLDGIQTLANKTLTAPKFADLGFIADSSGNEMLVFDSVSSAVNYIQISNSAISNAPTITASGSDTNINLNLLAKGTGTVKVNGDTITTLTAVQTLTNKTLTTPTIASFVNATHNHQSNTGGGTLDHGLALTGLSDDDHTQYVLLAGRAGGQTIVGGTGASNNLTFSTTSNTTKGKYVFSDLTASRVIKTNASSELIAATIVSTDLDASLFSTDATLGGSSTSDTKISSQKAIKTYVDNAITGLSWKEAVVVATTGNITLSGTQTIDTVAVVAGDRVLVKNQTDKKTNGIYIVAVGAWTRATDADTADELAKASVFVEKGSQNNTGWTCSNSTITEWTTDIEFTQFSGSGTYTGGTGIDIIGNDINIDNTVVTLTGTQTLTNKTLTDNVIVSLYQDAGKTHKLTFPAVTDTVVTLAATQTLSNKTLTAPKFADSGYIADSNGNELLVFGQVASAINYLKLTNSITANAVTLSSLGSTNASLDLVPNGTGIVSVKGDQIVTLTDTQTLTNKTLTTPTLTTPVIASFASANHNHQDSAGGGTLTDAIFTSPVSIAKGGTGLSSYTLGDILYASATNTLGKLAGNTTTTTKMLVQTGTGTVSSAPVWTKFEHQQTLGDGVNTDFVITHNLNSRGVKISVWRTASPYDEVDYYAEKTSVNTITLRFNRVILADEFSVSISI